MNKGERISQFVRGLEGNETATQGGTMADHPYYRAFFRCWNQQRYYEAHDVLEQIWLGKTVTAEDARYFKGLIQAAGAFVHLQKQFEHPTHPKHGKRLGPATRLFRLAEKNLELLGAERHELDLVKFREMLAEYLQVIVESEQKINPWSPKTAPRVELRS
jgi:predicted metal-dependent hydrolase